MKHTSGILTLMMAIFFAGEASASSTTPADSASPGSNLTSLYRTAHVLRPAVGSVTGKVDPSVSKKFFFSAVLTPDFTPTVPPVSLYFERGIAQFLSLGLDLGISYNHIKPSDTHSATVLAGARLCGFAIPAVAALGDKQIKSAGFDPYIGLLYNYYITGVSDLSEDSKTFSSSQLGIVVGTRWYPGNKRGFGILAEYGSTGITGGGVRFGITLGR